MSSTSDKFRGAMLGLALGDAIGAPYEGLSAETLYRDFGAILPRILTLADPSITYTDDTQMMIAVAECLIPDGVINPARLADLFAIHYEPSRSYGPGMQKVLDAMVLGNDWQSLVATLFPGGSFGNGAAMRVAPVGLLFHDDATRLRDAAAASAKVTHLHPLAVDSAVIVATAVAHLLRHEQFDRDAFYADLLAAATTEEFQWQLATAAKLGPDETISFGSTFLAHRSVTTAIGCFTAWPDSFERTIARAISFGEDTYTLAAIAGALCGAHLGVLGLPPNLLTTLENGPEGRDYIDSLAVTLFQQWNAPRQFDGEG